MRMTVLSLYNDTAAVNRGSVAGASGTVATMSAPPLLPVSYGLGAGSAWGIADFWGGVQLGIGAH